ncbi:MAG: mannose-1-phosphate guanylyltransferase [Candidatus Margulisbacteria bacterium]|nr:mannose-1-phosphate guanylyltransferase [Candidatus Margulisiibacteriota bacterium]
MSNRYAVILAGGKGKRLWPVSTDALPKQFLKLVDDKTLLQATFERLASFIGPANIRISVLEEFRPLVEQQLPFLNNEAIIVEPEGRNTAPSIALAVILIQRKDPDAVIGIFPVDHYIPSEFSGDFQKDIMTAYDFAANNDQIVTIGMEATSPSTAYGYLEYEPGRQTDKIYKVKNYLEKPSQAVAEKLLNGATCFWNGGIFVFKANVYLKALKQHLSETYRLLHELPPVCSSDYFSRLKTNYGLTEKGSIDRGLMEKLDNVQAVKAGFKRVDLGNFEVLSGLWQKDKDQNRNCGNALFISSKECISYADSGRIIFNECDGIVVLQAENNVVVCPRNKLLNLDQVKELTDGK